MLQLLELCGRDEAIKFSPYVWRVRLILMYKGLDFKSVPWRFTENETLMPTGGKTVPALCDNGKWISDSFEIAKYLDEAYPEKPIFTGEASITHAMFFDKWINRTLLLGFFPLVAADVWDNLTAEGQAYFRTSRESFLGASLEDERSKRDQAMPALLKALAPMRDILKSNAYLGGSEPSFHDLSAFGTVLMPYFMSTLDLFAADMK